MASVKRGYYVVGLPPGTDREYEVRQWSEKTGNELKPKVLLNRLERLCEPYDWPTPARDFMTLAERAGFHHLKLVTPKDAQV